MFSEGINKNALFCKKLEDVPFQSFFNKIFAIATFGYLKWLIILQNFKRVSWADSKNKINKLLGPIPGKNALFMGQQEPFEHIYSGHLYLLIFPYHHSKFQKDAWDVFGPTGIKMSHLQEIFKKKKICKNSKRPLERVWRKSKQAFRSQNWPMVKMIHIWPLEIFSKKRGLSLFFQT